MPDFTNMTKARQGIRMGGKMRWAEPGETITGQPDGAIPFAFKVAPDSTPAIVRDNPTDAPTDSPKPSDPSDKYEGVSDDALRDLVEDKTGKRPHANTGRAKLIEALG